MKNKSLITIFLVSIFFLVGSSLAFSQGGDSTNPDANTITTQIDADPTAKTQVDADPTAKPKPTPIVKLDNPIKANNIQTLLFTIVDLAIFLGSIIAVLMFVYVGFKFIMAQGNDSKITEAKEWFTYAVIGTAILISSKVIVEVVKNTLVSAGVVEEKAFTLPK